MPTNNTRVYKERTLENAAATNRSSATNNNTSHLHHICITSASEHSTFNIQHSTFNITSHHITNSKEKKNIFQTETKHNASTWAKQLNTQQQQKIICSIFHYKSQKGILSQYQIKPSLPGRPGFHHGTVGIGEIERARVLSCHLPWPKLQQKPGYCYSSFLLAVRDGPMLSVPGSGFWS